MDDSLHARPLQSASTLGTLPEFSGIFSTFFFHDASHEASNLARLIERHGIGRMMIKGCSRS